MKAIESITELSSMISPLLRKDILTNNYMLLAEYSKYIQEHELYFEESSAGILLLQNRRSHWRLFYYLRNLNESFPLPKDKPSAMEMIFKNTDTRPVNALSHWEDNGFKPYLFRERMSAGAGGFKTEEYEGESVCFAKEYHALSVYNMIKKAFDKYLGCIPTLPQVSDFIRKREILCIQNTGGQLSGLLHLGKKHDSFMILHLVVKPEAQKKGMAKKLLAYFNAMVSHNKKTRIQLWVNEDNIPARHLYEKTGFRYDGWKSAGLLFQPGDTD